MSDRNLKTGLIASIILNVFLIGGIAGGIAFWRLNPPTHVRPAVVGAQPRQGLQFAADELGPTEQRVFRQALHQARLDSLPDLRTAQAHRRELVGLIGARDFDRAAVAHALTGARTADTAVRRRLEIAVADYAADLTPTDRAVFVRGLIRSPTLRPPPPPKQKVPVAATENPAPAR